MEQRPDRDGRREQPNSAPAMIDSAGVVHEPAVPPFRIASLVPSITELLCDLGLADHVVARTAFCVHPRRRLRQIPSVGGTKTVNFDRLRACNPTHVIVNVDETPWAVAQRLAEDGYRLMVTHPVEVADNIALYRLIGGVFGCAAEAERFVDAFQAAQENLRNTRLNNPQERVLYLIWKNPWMTVSHQTYISRMLALIGWTTMPVDSVSRYPSIDIDDAFLGGIDRVLFATEPFPFRSAHVLDFGRTFPEHAGKAQLVDGQLLSWYGSRAILGLGYLSRLARAEA